MVLWPSTAWTEEYVKQLNEDEEFQEAGKGWGVDFDGDWLYVIEDFPYDKLDLENLPEEAADEAEYVVPPGTIYTHVKLKDGKCLGMEPIKDPDEVDVGFKFIGSYDKWKALTKGEADATQMVMRGDMKLEGDMSKVMRYIKMTNRMTKISQDIEVEFIDEKYAKE